MKVRRLRRQHRPTRTSRWWATLRRPRVVDRIERAYSRKARRWFRDLRRAGTPHWKACRSRALWDLAHQRSIRIHAAFIQRKF